MTRTVNEQLAEIEEKDTMIAKWAAKMKTGFGVRLDSYISSLRKKESPDPGPVRRHRRLGRHHAGPHHALAHGR